MKRRRKQKLGYLTRFADFILGFLLALFAIVMGHHAMASGIDQVVNTQIKEEFIRLDAQQRAADLETSRSLRIEDLRGETGSLPSNTIFHEDGLLGHADDANSVEQGISMDRPRVGPQTKIDPSQAIEQKIADDQAYQLYREHYRGAVKREVTRIIVHASGYQTSQTWPNGIPQN